MKIEAGKEKIALFAALDRLSRLGNLKDLVYAATTDGAGGWVYWTDALPGQTGGPTALRA